MRPLLLLFVVVSAAYAAQVGPSPVYRAQPTIMTAKNAHTSNNAMNAESPAPAQAEERESPAFPTSDNGKSAVVTPSFTTQTVMPASTLVQQPATLMQPAGLVQSSPLLQTTSSQTAYTSDPQQYQVYLMNPGATAATKPLTTPIASPYTSYTQQQAYDGQYNPLQYQPQATSPSDGLMNNLPWRDILIGLSSLALLGIGASMAYPALKGLSSRGLRELQDMKTEDAARMAKNVMRAIRKFSEINHHE